MGASRDALVAPSEAAVQSSSTEERLRGGEKSPGNCLVTRPITLDSPYPACPLEDLFPDGIEGITVAVGRGVASIERTSRPGGGREDGLEKTLAIPLDVEDAVW